MQNCGKPSPPLCHLGQKFKHTKGQNLGEDLFLYFFSLVSTQFWAKNWTKFGWRPFFFWSSPNFEPKTGLILSGEILLFVFVIFNSPPPLSKILRRLLVAARGATKGNGLRGLQPPLVKLFKKFNPKIQGLNIFWTWPEVQQGQKGLGILILSVTSEF